MSGEDSHSAPLLRYKGAGHKERLSDGRGRPHQPRTYVRRHSLRVEHAERSNGEAVHLPLTKRHPAMSVGVFRVE
jgi:hypothetical protein